MTPKELKREKLEQQVKMVKQVIHPDGIGGYTPRYVLCAENEAVSLTVITTMLMRCDYV